ncbi:MAG TPA: Maf family protein [Acidimicrobiales bacterium]
MTSELVLASSSVTRRQILQAAGIRFRVEPSGTEEVMFSASTSEIVSALATEKATAVAARISSGLVLGCDSLLDIDGRSFGKPASVADALRRWLSQRGTTGTLFTGHVLVDAATGVSHAETVQTVVHFGRPSEREIELYVASGEPLDKAGAFTLEGRSGPFIEGVEGDPGNVRGLSLPALRRLLEAHGRSIVEFWTEPSSDFGARSDFGR